MLQGADNLISRDFYKIAINYIPKGSKVLNLGCGIRFNFEKFLLENKKKIYIESIDILPVDKVPKFVEKFHIYDVEKKFYLDKKFDVVTFFELAEHIDKTDILFENCYNNLKKDGLLIFSFPNLSSLWCRMELFLGYQPHILEVSNRESNFGMGIFGKINNPCNKPIHHVRGITYKAMKEMIIYYKFRIIKIFGWDYRLKKIFNLIPSLAPVNIFICQKLNQ